MGLTRHLQHQIEALTIKESDLDIPGPENLKITEFFQRIFSLQIKEVILATNPSMEGEVTSMYINNFLSEKKIKTSVLARGLPIGSDLEYTDDLTLVKALEGRKLLD